MLAVTTADSCACATLAAQQPDCSVAVKQSACAHAQRGCRGQQIPQQAQHDCDGTVTSCALIHIAADTWTVIKCNKCIWTSANMRCGSADPAASGADVLEVAAVAPRCGNTCPRNRPVTVVTCDMRQQYQTVTEVLLRSVLATTRLAVRQAACRASASKNAKVVHRHVAGEAQYTIC